MFDCIYSAYCIKPSCDNACHVHAETCYWMERCGITINNPVLHISIDQLNQCVKLLDDNVGKVNVYRAKNTLATADLFCYCAICKYGHGTGLNGGVYNLNFSKYVEEIRKSWRTRYESEELDFMRIWTDSSEFLIISRLDYVNFTDFESQTLLSIMQSRSQPGKSTYIITPSEANLIGKGDGFYPRLLRQLKEAEIKC